jgi:hypothetical protein
MAGTTVMKSKLEYVSPTLSVKPTEKPKVPAKAGVPDIIPASLSIIPPGSEPVTIVHV